jgi:hypothetical protein
MLRLVRRSLKKAFGLTIRANFISSLLMVKKLWLQGYPTNPGSGHLQFHQITFQLGGLPSSKIIPRLRPLIRMRSTLVVCRNGRIFRLVSGGPIVWDWKFERGGRAVAYSTGSRHGGANECLLADIKSGKVLEKWPTPTRGRLPLWAEQLRR